MKQPRQQWAIDYTGEDHDNYVRLAHHVIWRATADLWSKEKHCGKADALAFLLVRVNEEDNVWGELARSVGFQRLTTQSLGALVRKQRPIMDDSR